MPDRTICDRIRTLTTEGVADSNLVVKAFQDTVINYAVCSPYIGKPFKDNKNDMQ